LLLRVEAPRPQGRRALGRAARGGRAPRRVALLRQVLTSARTAPEIATATPALDWEREVEEAAQATPYAGPTWLRLQERLATELSPCHAVATGADGGPALLPAYVVEAPGSPDLDPRTYLGWQAADSEGACCASPSSCCANASE